MTALNLHVISFTEAGEKRAALLCKAVQGSCASASHDRVQERGLYPWVQEHFKKGNALVFIGACGIAVRAIAPYVKDKRTDPAVLVLDEQGRFVIPILSGHIGQANEIAETVSRLMGCTAVITTASDVNQLPAIDVFAQKNCFFIEDMEAAKRFAARFLQTRSARLWVPESLYALVRLRGAERQDFRIVPLHDDDGPSFYDAPAHAHALLSPYAVVAPCVQLVPRCLVIGIGCRKGVSSVLLTECVTRLFSEARLSLHAVCCVASIDIKKEEAGIQAFARSLAVPFAWFSAEELKSVEGCFSASAFVEQTVGVDNVCERAAIAAGAERMLVPKTIYEGVTVAIGIAAVSVCF